MSVLVAEREVNCPPTLAVRLIYRAFGADEEREVTHRLVVPFEDLGLPKIGELAREVIVTLGEAQRRTMLTRIPLAWRVPDSNAFPAFRGFFEMQPLASWCVQLALLGYYHAPFGVFGAAFDAVLGHKIAQVTVHHLLDEVVQTLEKHALRPVMAGTAG